MAFISLTAILIKLLFLVHKVFFSQEGRQIKKSRIFSREDRKVQYIFTALKKVKSILPC